MHVCACAVRISTGRHMTVFSQHVNSAFAMHSCFSGYFEGMYRSIIRIKCFSQPRH